MTTNTLYNTFMALNNISLEPTIDNIAMYCGYPTQQVVLALNNNLRNLTISKNDVGQTIYNMRSDHLRFMNAWGQGKAMRIYLHEVTYGCRVPRLQVFGALNTPNGAFDWVADNLNTADAIDRSIQAFNQSVASTNTGAQLDYSITTNSDTTALVAEAYVDLGFRSEYSNNPLVDQTEVDPAKLKTALASMEPWGFILEDHAFNAGAWTTLGDPSQI